MGGEKDVLVASRRESIRFVFIALSAVRSRLLDRDDQVPVGERERLLDRLGQRAAAPFGVGLEPVDDDLDVVLDALVELQVVGQLHDLAIDAGADVAALHHVREEVLVLALLPADDRGEHQEPRPFRQREDAADDLLARLGRDGPAALRAMALAERGRRGRAGSRESR